MNVIADPVGASNAARNVASLAIDSRWVLFGTMGGTKVENFDLGALLAKRGALLTTTLKTRSKDYKKALLEEMSKVFFNPAN